MGASATASAPRGRTSVQQGEALSPNLEQSANKPPAEVRRGPGRRFQWGRPHGVTPGHATTIMREVDSQTAPDEQQEGEVPEWVLSIVGDRDISLTNKLRAMGAGFSNQWQPRP